MSDKFDEQEFHELMMTYRSASPMRAPAAYRAVQAFIRADLVPQAAPEWTDQELYDLYSKVYDGDYADMDSIINFGRALLAGKTAAPEGWKLVPIDPTDEMIAAYLTENAAYWARIDELPNTNPGKWRSGTPKEATRQGYRAMLQAVPTPPQPSSQVAQEWTDERILYRFAQLHMLHGGSSPEESLTLAFARAILAGKPAAPTKEKEK